MLVRQKNGATGQMDKLYPLVMEQEELANVGLKNRRHQC